jgi:hypothetical protein
MGHILSYDSSRPYFWLSGHIPANRATRFHASEETRPEMETDGELIFPLTSTSPQLDYQLVYPSRVSGSVGYRLYLRRRTCPSSNFQVSPRPRANRSRESRIVFRLIEPRPMNCVSIDSTYFCWELTETRRGTCPPPSVPRYHPKPPLTQQVDEREAIDTSLSAGGSFVTRKGRWMLAQSDPG